jgi:alkanesulfonate monooxygenase SsuD/methylene tetrahydromethanopterin reductase-like flavin-dependent oxidoreductase (luciferase family)
MFQEEYLAYGYPFPSAGVRIDQLDEAVQLIKRMWAESPASWQGRYFHVAEAYSNPGQTPCRRSSLVGAASGRRCA